MPNMDRFIPRHQGALLLFCTLILGCESKNSLNLPPGGSDGPDDPPPAGHAFANPFAGERLFVDPESLARKQVNAWSISRPAAAALLEQIASQPLVPWFTRHSSRIGEETAELVRKIRLAGALPLFVAYNIPNRDCGSFSGGGAPSDDAYLTWIRGIASGVGTDKTVILLEPDAINELSCLSSAQRQARFALIARAIAILRSHANIYVYLDAGNPVWEAADVVAGRLRQAGIATADGFMLNVSNFETTAKNVAYGNQVSAQVGGKHFIIDTSRNGTGAAPNADWCNPPGRALGANPTPATGIPTVDAFLWVKTPGESDGQCRGGPIAGEWFPSYALDLIKARAAL